MRLILLCLSLVVSTGVMGQRNCGAMDHLHYQMEEDPKRATKLQQIENHTNHWIQSHKENDSRDVITIPIVFHVVYRTASENISDTRLLEQLDVLNADYRRLNTDADATWPQAADVEIEFCLATLDPDGNPTSGITRTTTTENGFGTNDAVKYNSSGGKNAWPSSDYLNFWVCNIGGGILGYAQFPGGNPATDGVVNDYRYTGITGASAPFDLGRTATHEVGHWLNLRHIWGDGGCGVDDFVSDTPTSDGANYGCTPTHISCSNTDMVQNYMDYSDDACMNLFTSGQKVRMLALFSPGGARESLLSSSGCGTGNPPPPPPVCVDNVVEIVITLDNYPEETTWTLTNSSGTLVASGGTYGVHPDGSIISEELCLDNGCYDFTINDSYGDGICCSYGNGSYNVINEGNSLASGESFGSSETTNICVALSNPPTSTCNDGIQNGNEIGIDCGGSDCSACPTCNDGVQNGNETGVDCGGECTVCPTCNDGVQNGNEVGIDCGGPDCSACNNDGESTEILGSYFETGLDGWTDGGSDCYRYSGSRSYEGNYSIRIRDNSGSASSMTSPSLDLSGYNTVDVSFFFYPNSMESGEDFWLRYNDGSGWQTIATWVRGTSFNNNIFYTATVTLSSAEYNLGDGDQFRFQCDASANADRIYIDQVLITGYNGNTRNSNQILALNQLSTNRSKVLDDECIKLYPNPASSFINIVTEESLKSITVRDIAGKLVSRTSISFKKDVKLDISELKPGIYMISIETEEETMTRKFVKN